MTTVYVLFPSFSFPFRWICILNFFHSDRSSAYRFHFTQCWGRRRGSIQVRYEPSSENESVGKRWTLLEAHAMITFAEESIWTDKFHSKIWTFFRQFFSSTLQTQFFVDKFINSIQLEIIYRNWWERMEAGEKWRSFCIRCACVCVKFIDQRVDGSAFTRKHMIHWFDDYAKGSLFHLDLVLN